MPATIGTGFLKRAARMKARSWVLSPISARATTPVETSRASIRRGLSNKRDNVGLFCGTPMAKCVYTMRRVSKTVPPQRTILRDISLNFFPGAKIGVLGLNGSGKSTLLKIMAGVDDHYDGEVVRMPGIQVGFLPQEPQLEAEKTVRETIEEAAGDIAA